MGLWEQLQRAEARRASTISAVPPPTVKKLKVAAVAGEKAKAAVKRGRPKKEFAKEFVSLRLDPRVLAHYRATGDGWQARLNDDLMRISGIDGRSAPKG